MKIEKQGTSVPKKAVKFARRTDGQTNEQTWITKDYKATYATFKLANGPSSSSIRTSFGYSKQTLDLRLHRRRRLFRSVPFHNSSVFANEKFCKIPTDCSSLLLLEVLPKRVRLPSIHFDFGEEIKSDAVLGRHMCFHLGVASWLLATELVAGKCQDTETRTSPGVVAVQSLQLQVVGLRQTSFGCDIHNHQNVSFVLTKIYQVPIDVQGYKFVDGGSVLPRLRVNCIGRINGTRTADIQNRTQNIPDENAGEKQDDENDENQSDPEADLDGSLGKAAVVVVATIGQVGRQGFSLP